MSTDNKSKLSLDGIEQVELLDFAQSAYLNYSMNVIRDRALPSVCDGLKPVQRRIIYAMSKLGINSKAKHVKSARTVGEVLGRYHPHGDSACYEAMVLMAQNFSYRYPLIDGQGNWGDVEDPKSFAAMRYTESRLTAFAEVLLKDINLGCVEFIPNFDGTTTEPKALPARLPTILLNGTTGIAVGMATDIPPHNLTEISNAAIYLLDHEDASVEDLMNFVKGPDYPTGAEIINTPQELLNMYKTGRGVVRQRAIYSVTKEGVVIEKLPYQVSCGKIEKQIAEMMAKKTLPFVEDLINASDHENPCKLIIVPRSNRVDIQALMSHLFASTDLECTYKFNLNILGLDQRPNVKNLKTILMEWLTFRIDTVTRRLESRLQSVNNRLHLLAGLLIVYLNLDEVIYIIRNNDEPKDILMKKFNLSQAQVEYILETKLKNLARLEQIKIEAEKSELEKEKTNLEALLGSKVKLKNFIKKEIKEDIKNYGDQRLCPIIERQAAVAYNLDELTPSTPMTVILSKMGWVRAASGFDVDATTLTYRSGDRFLSKACGRSNQTAVFLTNLGRAYSVEIKDLPSARGLGEPLSAKVTLLPGEFACHVICANDDQIFLNVSTKAFGFLCKYKDIITKTKQGRAFINLDKDALLLAPQRVNSLEDSIIAIASKQGRILFYKAKELPMLSKGKGNKVINIPAAKLEVGIDGVAAICCVEKDSDLIVKSGKRQYTIVYKVILDNLSTRSRAGNALPQGFQRVDALVVKATKEEQKQDEEFALLSESLD